MMTETGEIRFGSDQDKPRFFCGQGSYTVLEEIHRRKNEGQYAMAQEQKEVVEAGETEDESSVLVNESCSSDQIHACDVDLSLSCSGNTSMLVSTSVLNDNKEGTEICSSILSLSPDISMKYTNFFDQSYNETDCNISNENLENIDLQNRALQSKILFEIDRPIFSGELSAKMLKQVRKELNDTIEGINWRLLQIEQEQDVVPVVANENVDIESNSNLMINFSETTPDTSYGIVKSKLKAVNFFLEDFHTPSAENISAKREDRGKTDHDLVVSTPQKNQKPKHEILASVVDKPVQQENFETVTSEAETNAYIVIDEISSCDVPVSDDEENNSSSKVSIVTVHSTENSLITNSELQNDIENYGCTIRVVRMMDQMYSMSSLERCDFLQQHAPELSGEEHTAVLQFIASLESQPPVKMGFWRRLRSRFHFRRAEKGSRTSCWRRHRATSYDLGPVSETSTSLYPVCEVPASPDDFATSAVCTNPGTSSAAVC